MMLMEEVHAVRKSCLDDASQELLVMLNTLGQMHQKSHSSDEYNHGQRPLCSFCDILEQKIELLKRSLLNDAQSLKLGKGSSLKHAKLRLGRVESLVDRIPTDDKSLKQRVESLRRALNNIMADCLQSEASFSFLTSDEEEDNDEESGFQDTKIYEFACWHRDLWLLLDDIVFTLRLQPGMLLLSHEMSWTHAKVKCVHFDSSGTILLKYLAIYLRNALFRCCRAL
jgi:hypothetical protein